jgi:hypothetical protein
MRNLFDQYTQPENRLTHALMCCLDKDRVLLKDFVKWSIGQNVDANRLALREQSLPGELADDSEIEAEKRGLPDGCLFDNEDWALLIESKFQANVTSDQLRRHLRTAEKRGLTKSNLLVLTAKPYQGRPAGKVFVKQWSELYRWLHKRNKSSAWAVELRQYLEVAEAREVASNYLTEGSLTVFSGIRFGTNESPYTYSLAKRILQLLRNELMTNQRLIGLGMDPDSEGRSAITGSKTDLVWDYIGLADARGAGVFTKFPHLTLGLRPSLLEACVTVPNGIQPILRKRLLGQNFESFESLITEVTVGLLKAIKGTPKAVPVLNAVQRHYLTRRGEPTIDSRLRFDLRTAIRVGKSARSSVKLQPQWLRATYDALRSRQSNFQIQVGVDFRYKECPVVATPEIAGVIADVWLACQPIIKAMLRPQSARGGS